MKMLKFVALNLCIYYIVCWLLFVVCCLLVGFMGYWLLAIAKSYSGDEFVVIWFLWIF